jgi:integrase/recombinase XerD
MSQRNVLRDIKRLCVRLGFAAPRRTVHATRHTFATEYLRRAAAYFIFRRSLVTHLWRWSGGTQIL